LVNPDGKPAWANITGVQNVVTSTATNIVSYVRNHPQVL